MYGYLSLCYGVFYWNLAVDPNDVRLSYTGTLARAGGFVVLSVLFAYIVYGYARSEVRLIREMPSLSPARRLPVSLLVIVLAIVALGVIWLPLEAGQSANRVKAGKPVGRLLFPAPLPPIPVLAIHADPAIVEPAGKPGDAPAAERLRGRKLLHLGQSGGTMVFYDAAAKHAIYIAADPIILHVANCDTTPPPDPSCAQITRY